MIDTKYIFDIDRISIEVMDEWCKWLVGFSLLIERSIFYYIVLTFYILKQMIHVSNKINNLFFKFDCKLSERETQEAKGDPRRRGSNSSRSGWFSKNFLKIWGEGPWGFWNFGEGPLLSSRPHHPVFINDPTPWWWTHGHFVHKK